MVSPRNKSFAAGVSTVSGPIDNVRVSLNELRSPDLHKFGHRSSFHPKFIEPNELSGKK